jgi:hypothetical protein
MAPLPSLLLLAGCPATDDAGIMASYRALDSCVLVWMMRLGSGTSGSPVVTNAPIATANTRTKRRVVQESYKCATCCAANSCRGALGCLPFCACLFLMCALIASSVTPISTVVHKTGKATHVVVSQSGSCEMHSNWTNARRRCKQ